MSDPDRANGPVIDLNADLGESFGAFRIGDDEAMLSIVTSANIACGFHAGDPLTLRRACASAVVHSVTIGAQVSYRDLAGFGRREMSVPPAELAAEVLYQIAALDGIARAEGGRVAYVKPHGALYHKVAADPEQATALVTAVRDYNPALPLLTLAGSQAATAAARAGMSTVAEAFADRGYDEAGTLIPRGTAGDLITDPRRAAAQAIELVRRGAARSMCVHGDTPGAVALAAAVREGLVAAGVTLAPFA